MALTTLDAEDRTFRPALSLLGYSFLILFIELALIRYIPGYVRVFGFYLNLVLIATFLGMGVGLLVAHKADKVRWIALPAILLLFAAVKFFANIVVEAPIDSDDFLWGVYFDISPTVQRVGFLPVVSLLFALTATVFVPLGALMGKEFKKFATLTAYTIDISGSLLGILAFATLSGFGAPPPIWFAVAFTIWAGLSLDHSMFGPSVAVVGALAVILAVATAGPKPEYWSPYYRINVFEQTNRDVVHVNGSMHQWMLDWSPEALASDPILQASHRDFTRPWQYLQRLDTVLVVGAGTGNDVTLLLQAGASYIDAVEIDPEILDLGRRENPLAPYSDPRVHTHVDDARNFLRRTNRKYDLIVFGTLDSQTLLSSVSSLRLDNYVYTVESFESARDRLTSDGTLISYHMSLYPYIGAKIAGALAEAFGEPPAVFYLDQYRLFNYTFVSGAGAQAIGQPVELASSVSIPRDDWPHLYLRRPTIPRHYLEALGLILVISLLFVRVGLGQQARRGFDWPMFFMGMGFLLIEAKSVAEMSLLFGSTWTVNVLVFSSVLVVILAANVWIIKRGDFALAKLFPLLFAALAVAYLVPVSAFLSLGASMQWLAGSAIVAGPIFFAAMIFATMLRGRQDGVGALASNVLGAIVGGLLEYSSMILGVKALYIVAALAYVGAFALARLGTTNESAWRTKDLQLTTNE